MFRKKYSLYLLIPLNIAIWGYFIASFAGFFSSETSTTVKTTSGGHHTQKDTTNYALLLSYKDPFLSIEKEKKRLVHSDKTAQKNLAAGGQNTTTKVVTATAPQIKYMGVIRNRSTGVVMGLISFKGESRIVKPKEEIEGVEFRNFLEDSMVCRFNNQIMVVRR